MDSLSLISFTSKSSIVILIVLWIWGSPQSSGNRAAAAPHAYRSGCQQPAFQRQYLLYAVVKDDVAKRGVVENLVCRLLLEKKKTGNIVMPRVSCYVMMGSDKVIVAIVMGLQGFELVGFIPD